ncbi:O-antigen ligase family protein [Desulfonatronovibrio magnus]|uniref:O-antigen ligase family protein n=1 Tax=Desulfonatronovibrio magnus TaxID=698827 RepID=UPI0005EB398B|nr:O-antigen ligase family protein [Desulfonatronovibrio magnus]
MSKSILVWIDESFTRLFNPGNHNNNMAAKYIGVLGLVLFAIGLSLGKSLQLIGIAAMLTGIIMDSSRFFKIVRLSKLMWMVICFLVFIWLRTFYGILAETDIEAHRLIDGARKYSYLAIVPIFAYWIKGDEKIVTFFFLITIISSVAYLMLFSGLDFLNFTQGRGVDLNLPTLIIAYAMFLSLMLLWIFLFALKIPATLAQNYFNRLIFASLLGFSFFTIAIALITLEARASSAALLLCIIIFAPCLVFSHLKKAGIIKTGKSATVFFICCTMFFLLFSLSSFSMVKSHLSNNEKAFVHLKQRINDDYLAIKHIINRGDIQETPITSLGERIYMWAIAWELIKEKPFFGHGRGVVIKIPDAAGPAGTKRVTPHFHNTIVEALVAWGIVGSMLLFGLFIGILIQAHRVWRKDAMSLEMYLYIIGGALIIVASGMTHSLGVRQTTWTYTALWAGVALSFCMNNINRSQIRQTITRA